MGTPRSRMRTEILLAECLSLRVIKTRLNNTVNKTHNYLIQRFYLQWFRAVARCFVTGWGGGEALLRVRKARALLGGGGVWEYPPSEHFQIWRLRNAIFSSCHEIRLRKIDLEYENGKQLQVTTLLSLKKTNPSQTWFVWLNRSRGGGGGGGLAPPLATALLFRYN